jgi:F0F1-type ATP synthase epsilon subunit
MADETPQPPTPETAELEKAVSNGRPTIAVKVYAPFKVYYEGAGYSLSAINETGPFDILPHHHKFLCMLVPCDLRIQTPDGEQVIKISRALMHVKSDSVTVFVDV